MINFAKRSMVGFFGLILLLSVFISTSPGADNIFKIAAIVPLSGPAAGWGIPADRGFKYVIDDYNKKGGLLVGGQRYKVEMVEYDNKYQTSETMTLLNKAIFGDKVKYLTVMGQHNCVVAAPVCETNKVLHLANASGGAELTNPKYSLTFRMMFNPNSLGSILYYPEMMKQFGVKTVALVNPDDDGGYTTSKAIKSVVEGLSPAPQIVADEYYVRGTADFTPVILRVLAKKPDLIDLGISSPGDTGLFLKQVGEAGYTGLHMNSASVVTTDVIWKAAGKYAKGHFVVGAFAKSPTPEYEALTKRYQGDFGGTVAPIIVYYSYENLKVLFLAIEKANTFDTVTVANTLGNMKWNSLYGPARWMGKEKILGFGIDRSFCTPTPMSRIGDEGKIEEWMLKSLPLEK
jgi:branched-chain amino acid transport system substrate-binding protein